MPTILELGEKAPQWLRDARTENAVVRLDEYSVIVWESGNWLGGDFLGGDFRGGDFLGGYFRGGDFRGGLWRGGVWHMPEDIKMLMAARCGIIFRNGWATAYRTTKKDGHGRHNSEFIQKPGKFYEDGLPAAGSGTCVRGIHVGSMAAAWTYFGVDRTCQMWEVRFREADLLDCDGEKARIRGGIFRKITPQFYGAKRAGGPK